MTPEPSRREAAGSVQGSLRGPIVLRRRDAERLYRLALDALLRSPREAGALLDEVVRAAVEDDRHVSDAVIGLGSQVMIAQSARGGSRNRRLTLVEPDEASEADGRLSVLTPLGAALLGLAPGAWVRFSDRYGGVAHVTVLDVAAPRPPEVQSATGDTPCPIVSQSPRRR